MFLFSQLKQRSRFVFELIGIHVVSEYEREKWEVGRRDRWWWNTNNRVLVKWAEDISTTHLNILLWSVFINARIPFESFDLLSNLFCETSRPAFIAFLQQYNPHRLVASTILLDVFYFTGTLWYPTFYHLFCVTFTPCNNYCHVILSYVIWIALFKQLSISLSLAITYRYIKTLRYVSNLQGHSCAYKHSSFTSDRLLC